MKVTISEIPQEGLDVELRETIKIDDCLSPVKASLRVEKVGAEILIKGKLSAQVELQCSRCLKDFESVISIPVDVVYHPVEELKGEENRELSLEELDLGFYSGEEFDLLDLVKEQLMLSLPMKPLCTDLCKGICPQCGTDLNTGKCGCSVKDIDPRLKDLKKLMGKGE